MRFLLPVSLLFVGACRPTSLLELDLFINSDALDVSTAPAAVYIDYGEGRFPLAISLCEWPEGQYQEASLDPVEFPACPETLTIVAAIAPFPEGNTCNQGAELPLAPVPEDTWFASGSVEAFATDACSVIETHQLVIEAPEL